MKTKKAYKLAQVVVKTVIDDWNQYALRNGGAPDDDFASEISKIISRLPRIKIETDARNAISEVMSEAFEPEQFTPDKWTDVGRHLVAC